MSTVSRQPDPPSPLPPASAALVFPQALTEVSLFQRDRIAQQLATRRGYLDKLLDLFRASAGGWSAVARTPALARHLRRSRPASPGGPVACLTWLHSCSASA